jgi:hypothetical protein
MKTDTELSLLTVVEKIELTLNEFNEPNWAQAFRSQRLALLAGEPIAKIAQTILTWFGGSGSFNDVILQNEKGAFIEANIQLDRLSGSLYLILKKVVSEEL